MSRRIWLAVLALWAAMLLEGCGLRTVEELYQLPKRSESYSHLQTAIDQAMEGLEYAAPIAGENQQTVQMADLDGDGADEYLLFARSTSEKTMQILIFDQAEEVFELLAVIDSHGTAFEQVEYVNIDDQPGLEIVVGRQVSDQVLRSLSVYTFTGGQPEQLMSASYHKFLTCDLDRDGDTELMLIQPGEIDADRGVAVLYGYENGEMARSREAEMSAAADSVKRIMVNSLHGGEPAVYVASSVNESAIITDIFAMKYGKFTNISFSNESGTSVQTLRNYYVYADDVDGDGVLELPSLITMQSLDPQRHGEKQYLIRWYAMDLNGNEIDKRYTFHNFVGGWYLELDSAWGDRVSVVQDGSNYVFHVWDRGFENYETVFRVCALTGTDRDEEALEDDRFVLYRADSVVYAAKLEAAAAAYSITQDDLISCFKLIHQDWKTGET